MKKSFLTFAALWALTVGVLLMAEDAVRIDAQKRPKIIKMVKPVYPQEAAKRGMQGIVELEATINTAGKVVDVKVLPAQNSQPLLESAAVTALRQWKYEPYLIAGKAKAVIFSVMMTFTLNENKKTMPPTGTSQKRPKIIKKVSPIYPEEAWKQKIQGIVIIEATTNEKGDVVAARVLPSKNPQPLLEEAALAAVRQWKYEPYLIDGKAEGVAFTVTVTFALQQDSEVENKFFPLEAH